MVNFDFNVTAKLIRKKEDREYFSDAVVLP